MPEPSICMTANVICSQALAAEDGVARSSLLLLGTLHNVKGISNGSNATALGAVVAAINLLEREKPDLPI